MVAIKASLITFRPTYLILTILLFAIEVCIAHFVHDKIVRPYLGDVLVVILIYCFLRGFFNISVIAASVATLLLAFAVEFLQLFNAVGVLGLEHSRIARTVIGTSFSWLDY